MWLQDDPDLELCSVRPGRAAGGTDWIGLRRNERYTVAGIDQLPLLPGILGARGGDGSPYSQLLREIDARFPKPEVGGSNPLRDAIFRGP
jgi:hypothetical protein